MGGMSDDYRFNPQVIAEYTSDIRRIVADIDSGDTEYKKPTARQRYIAFENDLRALINKHSLENDSDTPDHILASYLTNHLIEWNHAMHARKKHSGE